MKPEDTILYVPYSHVITLEKAKEALFGADKAIYEELRTKLTTPSNAILAVYILKELQNPDSFYRPFLDLLPQSCSNFPIFFGEDELIELEGSQFLDEIQ